MEEQKALGAWGEEEACRHLRRRGYAVLDRNARAAWGELDVVARAPDRTLVFIEVKTLHTRPPEGLEPEDHMTAGKMERFRRAASLYAGSHPRLVDAARGWRLDVLAIAVPPPTPAARPGFLTRFLRRARPSFTIRHYENIG